MCSTATWKRRNGRSKTRWTPRLFGDGTANGGKSITGLGAAVPIVTTTGTYGGINRATATIWRTTTYDAALVHSAIGTQVNSTTIRPMLNAIMTAAHAARTTPIC